jgi:hypothetical protein
MVESRKTSSNYLDWAKTRRSPARLLTSDLMKGRHISILSSLTAPTFNDFLDLKDDDEIFHPKQLAYQSLP